MKKTISISIDPKLYEDVKLKAKLEGLKISRIVAIGFERYLQVTYGEQKVGN